MSSDKDEAEQAFSPFHFLPSPKQSVRASILAARPVLSERELNMENLCQQRLQNLNIDTHSQLPGNFGDDAFEGFGFEEASDEEAQTQDFSCVVSKAWTKQQLQIKLEEMGEHKYAKEAKHDRLRNNLKKALQAKHPLCGAIEDLNFTEVESLCEKEEINTSYSSQGPGRKEELLKTKLLKFIFKNHPEKPLTALKEKMASSPNKTNLGSSDLAEGKKTDDRVVSPSLLDCSENCEEAPLSLHLEPNRAKENNHRLPRETNNKNDDAVSSDQDSFGNESDKTSLLSNKDIENDNYKDGEFQVQDFSVAYNWLIPEEELRAKLIAMDRHDEAKQEVFSLLQRSYFSALMESHPINSAVFALDETMVDQLCQTLARLGSQCKNKRESIIDYYFDHHQDAPLTALRAKLANLKNKAKDVNSDARQPEPESKSDAQPQNMANQESKNTNEVVVENIDKNPLPDVEMTETELKEPHDYCCQRLENMTVKTMQHKLIQMEK